MSKFSQEIEKWDGFSFCAEFISFHFSISQFSFWAPGDATVVSIFLSPCTVLKTWLCVVGDTQEGFERALLQAHFAVG